MTSFWLTFIPLFVAVDSMGILPLFMSLTEGIDPRRIRTLVLQSVATAMIVGLAFLFVGSSILKILGITIEDFMIAGGILLFMFSLTDLITMDKRQRTISVDEIGAVPIGIPLIVGPAVLTTGLLLVDQFGMAITALALCLNVLVAGTIFLFSPIIARIIGKTGGKIISKLASLLLAAFAVMMIRKGVVHFLVK